MHQQSDPAAHVDPCQHAGEGQQARGANLLSRRRVRTRQIVYPREGARGRCQRAPLAEEEQQAQVPGKRARAAPESAHLGLQNVQHRRLAAKRTLAYTAPRLLRRSIP